MAFDAAAPAVQAPPPGSNASAKPAARQGDASDPFGALLAMLDGAQTDNTAATPSKTAPGGDTDKTVEADSPAPAKADKTDKAAPAADEAAPSDAPVSDPALLMAAMMVPAATTPAPVAAVSEAAVPASAQTAVAPQLDIQPPVNDAEAAPIAAEALPAAATAQADQPAPLADIEIPAPAVLAEAEPAAPQPAAPQPALAAAQPRLAANDKPADPARTDASATETPAAGPVHVRAQGDQEPSLDSGADGQSSDAQTAQQAQIEGSASPAPDAATFAAAAAAPEAPAPAVGVAQAPAPAPVIAAQAAVAPVRGSPETVAHLAAQMIQRLDGQTTRFDLTLNPQSLGRVDVRIEIGAKGALRARMAFDDAATAHEMSGRHTELRAALQNAGFDVPEGSLSFDVASGGGGAFAERQDADRAATPFFQNFADTADQDPAAVVKNYFSAAGSTGVDIRV